jgi:tripartite-type tricarboxylate transporter receptor subunit TctC
VKKALKIAFLLLLITARMVAQSHPERGVRIIVTARFGIFDTEARMPQRFVSMAGQVR